MLAIHRFPRRGADGADISEEALDVKHKEMGRLGLHTERLKAVVQNLEAASDCRNLQVRMLMSFLELGVCNSSDPRTRICTLLDLRTTARSCSPTM